MPTQPTAKSIFVAVLPAVLTIFIIFFIIMPKVRKNRQPEAPAPVMVNSFQECVDAGNPVMESYPRQCRHEDRLFVEDVSVNPEPSRAERLQVETYIREHIGELSPEPPVLGGTFYVTAVSFLPDGEVLVNYEDGHIALSARGMFALDMDGSVRVERFVLSEPGLSEVAALKMAVEAKACTDVGDLKETGSYNPNSRTWWFDLVRDAEADTDGCSPACVIWEENGEAEVNWRCTGLRQ